MPRKHSPREHSPHFVRRGVHAFNYHPGYPPAYPPINIAVHNVDLVTIDPATLYANFVVRKKPRRSHTPRTIALVNSNHRPLDAYDILQIRKPLHVPGYI